MSGKLTEFCFLQLKALRIIFPYIATTENSHVLTSKIGMVKLLVKRGTII